MASVRSEHDGFLVWNNHASRGNRCPFSLNCEFGIVNLWTMLKKYGHRIVRILDQLESSAAKLIQRANVEAGDVSVEQFILPKDDIDVLLIHVNLMFAIELFMEIDSDIVHKRLDRVKRKFEYDSVSVISSSNDVKNLCELIVDVLESRHFLFVPDSRVGYYKQPALFGDEVNDRFPSAARDIQEAGSCLALGLGTASVFHCMRALEVALRGVAKSLQITYRNDCGSYMEKIDLILKPPQKTSPPQAKQPSKKRSSKKGNQPTRKQLALARQKRDFYAEMSVRLQAVKDAWRNNTMHMVRSYDLEEAEEIMRATRRLMQHAAGQISE